MRLTPEFQRVAFPRDALPGLAREWMDARHTPLDRNETMNRVSALKSFMLAATADHPHAAQPTRENFLARKAEIAARFPRESALGAAYHERLGYSPRMVEMAGDIARGLAARLAARRDADRIEFGYETLSDDSRATILSQVLETYFDVARDVTGAAKLKTPKLVWSDRVDYANGWVDIRRSEIENGIFGPVYLHPRMAGAMPVARPVETVAHEATHHMMQQMLSLAARRCYDMQSDPGLRTDYATLALTVECAAFSSALVAPMYEADSFERIARETGRAAAENFHITRAMQEMTPAPCYA
jgi:hypothetical protein